MRHVLLDTNVILDAFLHREPFWKEAGSVFDAINAGTCVGYVSATTITDIYYILKKHVGNEQARFHIENLANSVGIEILAVNRETVIQALELPLSDFEDAVQVAVALQNRMMAIITRNVRDFRFAHIDVCTPEQFLAPNRDR
ncbi:MAG: type II toxin-antitoxin system VapC family toxin [Thermoguttaceae bacterium]